MVLGARRRDRLDSLAAEITTTARGKAFGLATEVVARNQVKNLVDVAVRQFGRLDVLINNAGIMPQAPLDRLKIDEWDQLIVLNIQGVLGGIAPALPHMPRLNSGQIINVSSVARHKVGPGFTV